MMIKKFKAFIFTLIYAMLSLERLALADEVISIPNPIQAKSFGAVIKAFADLVTKIGIPIATVFLIYAGLLFVTARGNEDQLKKAKETFKWTIIGTAILVGAYAIASAIVNFAEKL